MLMKSVDLDQLTSDLDLHCFEKRVYNFENFFTECLLG